MRLYTVPAAFSATSNSVSVGRRCYKKSAPGKSPTLIVVSKSKPARLAHGRGARGSTGSSARCGTGGARRGAGSRTHRAWGSARRGAHRTAGSARTTTACGRGARGGAHGTGSSARAAATCSGSAGCSAHGATSGAGRGAISGSTGRGRGGGASRAGRAGCASCGGTGGHGTRSHAGSSLSRSYWDTTNKSCCKKNDAFHIESVFRKGVEEISQSHVQGALTQRVC